MRQYFYTAGYVISTSLSVVWIKIMSQSVPPILSLFVSSLIAIWYFHLVNVKTLPAMYRLAWQYKWQWLGIMVIILLTWLATIYGPTFDPDIFILLYFSTNWGLGVLFSLKSCSVAKRGFLMLCLLGVIAICAALILLKYPYTQAFEWPLLGMGLLGGVSGFVYSKQTFKFLTLTHLKATQVLALRFWLILIVCFIFLPQHALAYLTWHSVGMLIFLAFISLIIPIYLYQKGIEALGPEKNSIVCGFIPEMTYILALRMDRSHFQLPVFILYFLIGLCISLPMLHLFRRQYL